MPVCADLRIVFRAACGPTRGFGHLVRCRSLARALGVRPLVSVRGGHSAIEAALRLGCDVVRGEADVLIPALAPDVLVVDEPSHAYGRRWIAAGRRAGVPVVSMHDLGLGCREADMVVDGSVTRAAKASRGESLTGPRYAVVDPAFACRPSGRRTRARRILVALGGGPHGVLAQAIARAIVDTVPDVTVRVAGGLAATRAGRESRRLTWTGPLDGLAGELSRCDVAVVGGGVSLYEACARGVAAIGVSVVAAQRPTVNGFAARAAARSAGCTPNARRAANQVVVLLRDAALRRETAARGRRLVDGRGASRVAAAIDRLVGQTQDPTQETR